MTPPMREPRPVAFGGLALLDSAGFRRTPNCPIPGLLPLILLFAQLGGGGLPWEDALPDAASSQGVCLRGIVKSR